MHKNEFQFKNTGSIIPIYRKSNKRERKPMKYYIKFIGFTLFEKETYNVPSLRRMQNLLSGVGFSCQSNGILLQAK